MDRRQMSRQRCARVVGRGANAAHSQHGPFHRGADARPAPQDVAGLLAAANATKQSGPYTDFDPDSGSWATPGTVTCAEFEKLRAVVGDFVTGMQRQIEFSRFPAHHAGRRNRVAGIRGR
jgi:hypothetical protein